MIEYTKGDIFKSGCDILVNPVNCIGPMGAGLAKEFASRYPGLERAHKLKCEVGMVAPGYLWIYDTKWPWVLNFPTKQDWRKPSNMRILRFGLFSFLKLIKSNELKDKSFAFPPLGCGLGGLQWPEVKVLMHDTLHKLPHSILVFEPY